MLHQLGLPRFLAHSTRFVAVVAVLLACDLSIGGCSTGAEVTSAEPSENRSEPAKEQHETKSGRTENEQHEPPNDQPPANRLADETSPYLLMHAHNPVNWYPWGPEALAKAKQENKVIFLSVGYSSCHWCHVMEQESFRDVEIAKFLNQHFVCIKVDREERPDIDEVYMKAVQIFSQLRGGPARGGWPMSVFLTPEGGAFFWRDLLSGSRR